MKSFPGALTGSQFNRRNIPAKYWAIPRRSIFRLGFPITRCDGGNGVLGVDEGTGRQWQSCPGAPVIHCGLPKTGSSTASAPSPLPACLSRSLQAARRRGRGAPSSFENIFSAMQETGHQLRAVAGIAVPQTERLERHCQAGAAYFDSVEVPVLLRDPASTTLGALHQWFFATPRSTGASSAGPLPKRRQSTLRTCLSMGLHTVEKRRRARANERSRVCRPDDGRQPLISIRSTPVGAGPVLSHVSKPPASGDARSSESMLWPHWRLALR